MTCRRAVTPIIVGLGTAAILASGGASAVAVADSPSGSPSTSPSDGETTTPAKPGTLNVTLTPAKQDSAPGEDAKLVAHISSDDGALKAIKVKSFETSPATANAKVGGDCPSPYNAKLCTVGDLDSKSQDLNLTLTVPKATAKTVTVTVKLTVTATDVDPKSAEAQVTYKVTPATTPTHTPPPKTSPPPNNGGGGGGGGNGGGGKGGGGGNGGSGGTGGSGGGNSSVPGPGTGTGGVIPPAPNASFDPRNPQVALPPIASPNAQNPSVAPNAEITPQSRLQGNNSPVADDLTFERIASTQIAWLAALMVAFSLLLTQVRLGRRRQPAVDPKRAKGTHRRPRKGSFGK